MSNVQTVELGPEVELTVAVTRAATGARPRVVLLPSANRSAADFEALARALAQAGYGSVAVNPRGVAGSTGPTEGLTMEDLAGDVAGVVAQLVDGPAHVVGHALGNTIARATATYRPEVVRSLALLACGGHDLGRHPPAPEVMAAFGRCHDPDLDPAERLTALQTVFFAAGNDPSEWLDGWWPGGQAVSAALGRSDWREWWRGGDRPVLIFQPTEDAMAPVAVGRELAAELAQRARYVEVPHCGHAILPERPEVVERVVVSFLAEVDATPDQLTR